MLRPQATLGFIGNNQHPELLPKMALVVIAVLCSSSVKWRVCNRPINTWTATFLHQLKFPGGAPGRENWTNQIAKWQMPEKPYLEHPIIDNKGRSGSVS